MTERIWVDESFSSEGFTKSLTGKGTTSIDYSKIGITNSGEIALANQQPTAVTASPFHQNDSQAVNAVSKAQSE